MAKTLAQGRKPGSGRKPGKGKTLAEGRKPGSGRKKRDAKTGTNNLANTNSPNAIVNNLQQLFQSQLGTIALNLHPLNVPSNQHNDISNSIRGVQAQPNYVIGNNSINNELDLNRDGDHSKIDNNNHNKTITTRDMVAVDALRELTHSPPNFVPSNGGNIINISSMTPLNMIKDTKALDERTGVTDNLILPPLNEIFFENKSQSVINNEEEKKGAVTTSIISVNDNQNKNQPNPSPETILNTETSGVTSLTNMSPQSSTASVDHTS